MTKTTPKYKPDCIFCQIAEHKLPSKVVNENKNFIAFYDINPVSKGHTLVIPKAHLDDFTQLVQENAKSVLNYLKFIEETRKKLNRQYKPKGVKIVLNTDDLIEVPHLHVHLIPVY